MKARLHEDSNGLLCELPPGCYEDEEGGVFCVAPAVMLLAPLEKGVTVSEGGIVIPDGSAAGDGKGNKFDKLKYGVVIGCGIYSQRNGELLPELPGWPLPLGTLVEHENHAPMETATRAGIQIQIRCDQYRRHWLPGQWPRWATFARKEI